jgi:hypothetical protein
VGDTERVEGALTAIESMVDAVVDKDAAEPVLRADAARRGRDVPLEAEPLGSAFIRFTSCSSDGGRAPAGGRSGFGASMFGMEAMVVERQKQYKCTAKFAPHPAPPLP